MQADQVNLADHAVAWAKRAPDLGPDPAPGMTRFIEPLERPVECRVEVSSDGATWATVFSRDGGDSPHRQRAGGADRLACRASQRLPDLY